MRAASTGGGLVRLVVIWLVVLAALVMTAAGASSTSAAAASATVTATATATAATAAAHRTAMSPTAMWAAAAARAASGARAAENATTGRGPCELVRVSLRKPACTGQISEGPGPPQTTPPPPPRSRCPACARRTDNNKNNNKNNNVNNKNDYGNYKINDKKNNNYNNSNHECLEYARRELIPEMCPDDPTAYRSRPGRLSRYRLRHCCHHTVESAAQQPYSDKASCYDRVNEALDLDDVAAAMSCQFDEVLARYDCNQLYSAKSCDSCKDAYALWACAAVLPHWTRTTEEQGRRYRVNACQSVCLEAEQKCPWLLPVADDANPYAGEAAFTCIDPDIGYQMSSTNAAEDCCYEHCTEHGLCVRNSSACDRGDDANQRPLCVEKVPLQVEESECMDFSPTSGGGDRARPAPRPLVSLLLPVSLLLLATCARTATAATAPTAAVT